MMAYENDYVLCVLHNGSPVREINGSITLPFHSEYKIRLKNKHSFLRAKVRVWVDGRPASNLGDFILQPGQTLDLERFLDSDLNEGNRFKFVPLSDSRVNDPTDPDNGKIKVEFYRELGTSLFNQWRIAPLKDGPIPTYPSTPLPWYNDNTSINYVHTSSVTSRGSSGGSVNCFNSIAPTCDSAGATVEGGASDQKFSYGDYFSTEVTPTTLTLQIRGIKKPEIQIAGEPQVNKPQSKIRYCAGCGARRRRRTDNFCQRCGAGYPRKRCSGSHRN